MPRLLLLASTVFVFADSSREALPGDLGDIPQHPAGIMSKFHLQSGNGRKMAVADATGTPEGAWKLNIRPKSRKPELLERGWQVSVPCPDHDDVRQEKNR